MYILRVTRMYQQRALIFEYLNQDFQERDFCNYESGKSFCLNNDKIATNRTTSTKLTDTPVPVHVFFHVHVQYIQYTFRVA